jgi:imidazolonepropionase-like amidohydrolase
MSVRALGTVSGIAAVALSGCVHVIAPTDLVTVQPTTPVLLFHDVNVFTATSHDALPHQDVVVRGGHIASVEPTVALDDDTRATWSRARIIEGAGKTLMPGLIDAHSHPTGTGAPYWWVELPDAKRNLEAHLAVGVTTIYAPGGDLALLHKLARDVDSGHIDGPRVFYAGQQITAAGGYPTTMLHALRPWPLADMAIAGFTREVHNATEARLAARRNLEGGASFIKVMVTRLPDENTPRLSEDELAAIVDETHLHHKKVVAHVDDANDALLCARMGVDALWHGVQLDTLTPAQVTELTSRIHIMTPTIGTFDRFEDSDAPFVASPLLQQTEPASVLQQLGDAQAHHDDKPAALSAWLKRLEANHDARRANVKALHDAGMTMLVGTDANGADGSFPAAIHDELVLMHEAGLDNAEVLLGATAYAARFLTSSPDFGTVEAGKVADLLLVDGDPVADLHATAHIALVVKGGRIVDRLRGFSP